MSPSSNAAPLSALTRLSSSVYLSEPPQRSATHSAASNITGINVVNIGQTTFGRPSPPSPRSKLIVLFTWMSAHPSHISKYVSGYRTHYPTCRILVIRSSPADMFYRPTQVQRHRVTPAVSALLSHFDTHNDSGIIFHIFSNGGSHQFCNFFHAYSEITSQAFPSHIKIFDSCPGRGTFKRTILALSPGLPLFLPARFLSLLLIYVVISIYWVIFVPLKIPDPIERLRQTLNSQTVMPGETKRCYIYSETDPMVGWRDVEDHAREAARLGAVVQCEKFERTGHCAHVREGGGVRYWAIVDALCRADGHE